MEQNLLQKAKAFGYLYKEHRKEIRATLQKGDEELESILNLSHPQPPPKRIKGARNYTGTLYLLFQTLVVLSLITESKYHIQIYKNKTTTIVVFTMSIHIFLSPIYIYIYKKTVHLHLHNQGAKPTMMDWPSSMRKIADVLLCTYTD